MIIERFSYLFQRCLIGILQWFTIFVNISNFSIETQQQIIFKNHILFEFWQFRYWEILIPCLYAIWRTQLSFVRRLKNVNIVSCKWANFIIGFCPWIKYWCWQNTCICCSILYLKIIQNLHYFLVWELTLWRSKAQIFILLLRNRA